MTTAATGKLIGLQRTPSRRATPLPLDRVDVRADWGIEGDRHARPGSGRQVVVVEGEVLDELDLVPGQLREQLTIAGLDGITTGSVIRIGDVSLEVTAPCVPCRVMDEIRPGLKAQLAGRRGWCCRVASSGSLSIGDAVTVEAGTNPEWLDEWEDALAEWQVTCNPPGSTAAELDARLRDLIDTNADAATRLGATLPPLQEGDGLWQELDQVAEVLVGVARRDPRAAQPVLQELSARIREDAASR